MNYTALIVAAGSGRRMGLGYNKVFLMLENGLTVLQQTIQGFDQDERCKQIVLVISSEDMQKYIKNQQKGKIILVQGGSTRQESVNNGLMAVHEEVVLIHDAARPWLPLECIDRILFAMESEQACMLTVPCKDTVKEVKDGYITHTFKRDDLRLAQTPQAFRTNLIIDCFMRAKDRDIQVTDDAQMVELMSDVKVKEVEGSYLNIKITTKEDIK